MHRIGLTIQSTLSRQHDDAILTQTFEDLATDSLAWDTLSEEFPLLIGPLSNPQKDLELDSYRSCTVKIDKQTVPHSINTSKEQVGNSREHAQNPCGLSGLIELEEKMAEFYVTE